MEMFGQAEKQQSLIIVHSDDTVAYANYLMMLIASNDDEGNTIVGVKDGSIKTMVWSIKQYLDNKPQLSSDQHTLFIGQDKKISEECYGMEPKFSKYGMSYGWLGKRANLKVTDTSVKKNDVKDLLQFAENYEPKKDEKQFNVDATTKSTLKQVATEMIMYGVLGPLSTAIDYKKYKDKIKNIQYKCLTTVFYREGLSKFFEM